MKDTDTWVGKYYPDVIEEMQKEMEKHQQKKEAIRYNKGKPRLDLVDPDAIEGLAKVLTFGADKYKAHNWRLGLPFSNILASLERHLLDLKRGLDTDPESGLPIIDHLGCNWMFLSYYMKHRPDLDDRWKYEMASKG